METTATKTKPTDQKHDTDLSVYVADQDIVKTYPRSMSNDEIDFDLHTTVRKQKPEDYFVNFLPLREIQQGFGEIINGGITGPAVKAGVSVGKMADKAVKYQEEEIVPAFKYAITGDLEKAYKPWLDIWKESVIGKTARRAIGVDESLLYESPVPGMSKKDALNPVMASVKTGAHTVEAMPWFLAEFVPEQLLEFGTRPLNWVGSYGIEKFGPPLINAAISKLPEGARATLLQEIFKAEIKPNMKKAYETLGLKPGVKTSEVRKAYVESSKFTHPDMGGSAEEFNAVHKAYTTIMKTRGGVMDQLFDTFRSQEASIRPKKKSMLLNQKGSAIVPGPEEGDLIKLGKDVGKVLKISGNIAMVNIAGKTMEVGLNQLKVIPKEPAKKSAVNLENLNISDAGKKNLLQATEIIKDELQNYTAKPISHEEVIAKASEAEILTKGVSREATLDFQASLLKTRQHLSALAQQNELTPEFLDTLKVMSNLGTDIARNLESLKIQAMPEYATTKVKVINDLIKLGHTSQEIIDAAKGVDFKDEASVAKFYRKFVKPTLPEVLDEFVYMNILSSPLTHIKNTFSNLIQLAGLNPLTRLASGTIDFAASAMSGKERTHYVSEIPDFYKGAINALPKAVSGASKAMTGKKTVERPDLKHLPTLSKFPEVLTLGLGKYFIRALEASDVFFRSLIEGGEIEALSKALGHEPTDKEMVGIKEKAGEKATYFVFRQKPDAENKTEQGDLLSAIDKMTNAVYQLRKVPGMKWFIRFVQTPMNIFKQMIEYSPAGIATLKGSSDKSEQAGKAAIGSIVFAGASWLAANNLTTWAAPKGAREKNEFYAAGLQPYSIRIGDKWFSYSQIGPIGAPIAMAAALHYFTKESPNALSDSEMDKVVDALSGIMRYFSDQSYMQGISDLVSAAHGEKSKAIASAPTQLIPLSSLQGWVNNILDPLQRKAEKGLSIESVVDNIQMKIVGMSKFVPAQIDEEDVPVKKTNRATNALSPVRVSDVNPGKLADYKENQQMKREINLIKKESEQ